MLSLITGVGAKGQVGETVALALARRGDTVLVVSRSEAETSERAAELVRSGHDAHPYACDLSDPRAVAELGRRVRERHGERLDALVNLAGGFAMSGPFAASDLGVMRKMFQINFDTAWLVTREFLPALRSAGGSVVFFASEAVLEGSRTGGLAGYVAAKSAVVALMRSVSDELRGDGVRANALAPASIRTGTNEAAMGADARYVEREEVAAAVAFLCSSAARAVTGQVIRLRR